VAVDTASPRRLGCAFVDSRVAVLASGSGTNLQALLDEPEVGRHIVLVLSDRPEAKALDRARTRGIATAAVEPSHYPTRVEFDLALLSMLRGEAVEYILLAGFMRILGPEVVRAFRDRILNVHPSLLPAFPGAHAPRDALAWGAKVSGATVHLVDEEIDHGPIVLQEPVAILPDDDERTLHARIQEVEHRLYPRAARLVIRGMVRVEGRRVVVSGEEA
jgi:phosphoribosylglycinamide formyltransferase-1